MSIVLQSTGGGSVTINEPSTASNFTQTLPAATGDVMVSGNMPAFSAYSSAANSASAGVALKLTLDVEEFDTNSNFASSRFTPTVAGYYVFSSGCYFNAASNSNQLILYKNGSAYKDFSRVSAPTIAQGAGGSAIAYANGSTDYFECYILCSSATNTGASSQFVYFAGSMVRGA